jgi:hypothetical protein
MAEYEEVLTVAHVLVRVPKEGRHMKFVKSHSPVPGVTIYERYQNGMLVGNGRILNRNFFHLSLDDLGKKITATVKVIKKKMDDDREFTMIDILKDETGFKPTTQMKLVQNSTHIVNDGEIHIIGTNGIIRFTPIEQ